MSRSRSTLYFESEGRAHMETCVRAGFDWCAEAGIAKVVMFTGTGDGPQYAAETLLFQPPFRSIKVIAVTPPHGRVYRSNPQDPSSHLVRAGISAGRKDVLLSIGISVVAAHLPFKEVWSGRDRVSPWSGLSDAFGILGGGFALCVQATLVACDSGEVGAGERVVVMTADTALSVVASSTENFLLPDQGLLVEHIICRPERYTISRPGHIYGALMWHREQTLPTPRALPAVPPREEERPPRRRPKSKS